MKNRIALIAFLIVSSSVHGGVDLTPRYTDVFFDGITSRRLYFADGATKIGINVDRETEVEGDGSGVVFRFPKFPDASFRIGFSSLTTNDVMGDEGLSRYRDVAMALLPKDAIGAKIISELADPLPINRWRSYRFVLAYEGPDGQMTQSVTFLNINKEQQLLLVTKSLARNFAEAAERSFQLIRSWHEIDFEDEKNPKGS